VILETVNNPAFLKDIVRKGEKFESILKGWKDPRVKEIRARGLMLGVDITEEAWPVLEKGISRVYSEKDAHGLLLLSAGKNTLRLLPPYIVSDSEIEQGLEILRSCL
jgi:acetylornithine/N-succinyldiaminopimelate aminotransferase